MYLLGYDVGSSSIKAALVNADTNKTVCLVQYPSIEMDMISIKTGWAEQDPEMWWKNVCLATEKLIKESDVDPQKIVSIGISYQMHGLVLVDKNKEVLRPSIIWCDSRAGEIGRNAFNEIGPTECLNHILNSPGNFTVSKLKWVKDHEPDVYDKVHKFMLPGDFIAMKLTGNLNTTISGLSEAMLWDFKEDNLAHFLLQYYGIDHSLVPEIVPTFSNQGNLTLSASEKLGLSTNTIVTYRAGDQPNNAMSLGVTEPGQVAATGGTSGVVYGIFDKPVYDSQSRINSFAHVNHSYKNPRIGSLLCINGTGIQYSWMKHNVGLENTSYEDMEKLASSIPIGSDGLRIIPFGNGAERIFGDLNLGSQILNLQLNKHSRSHLFRAALEGIAFSFVYGMDILKDLGINLEVIRVGNDNLFRSTIFSTTLSALLGSKIDVIDTTGAIGAAKAGGVKGGAFNNLNEAIGNLEIEHEYLPPNEVKDYMQAYEVWKNDLTKLIK